ncbi:ATP-binding protein [Acuticoccus sp. M5D2P5]|uniref:sensor histidine kinase n=1 Tax=Acuticoccus kalidii TaxID=2910977 RepID=UPI001F1FB911|nr:ATP-binding protein [Acuticoccus kalidii]MCF3932060.1 ATP-binding protein [Acuticoccus kalidii]
MRKRRRSWSLAEKIRHRLTVVTATITCLTVLVVALVDGRDLSELPQRIVLGMVQDVAEAFDGMTFDELPLPHEDEIGGLYDRHPEAYGWRVLGRGGTTLAESNFDWAALTGIPVSAADEWTHDLGDGRWIGGKTFRCEAELCEVQVVVLSDPEYRLLLSIVEEIGVHVLPIFPLAALMLLVSGQVIRATLKPLEHLAGEAKTIREFRDVEPIDVGDAPAEVRELAGALNATLQRLRDAMERERAFILDASHSLRTPLAALKARLEVDQDAVDVASLRREIDTLVRLCAQMLSSAQAERLLVEASQRIDAETVIIDVITRLEPLAHKAGVEFAYECQSPPTAIAAHSDAIAVALVNLVENAVQHAPRGSEVVIRLEADPVRISVIDRGKGVPPDRLPAIADRFVRAGAHGDGAGLGLYIAARIMAAHGGRLAISNLAPTGLRVELVFPG